MSDSTPIREVPDIKAITVLARMNFPDHYSRLKVSFGYSSRTRDSIPDDFEILIQYENLLKDLKCPRR